MWEWLLLHILPQTRAPDITPLFERNRQVQSRARREALALGQVADEHRESVDAIRARVQRTSSAIEANHNRPSTAVVNSRMSALISLREEIDGRHERDRDAP